MTFENTHLPIKQIMNSKDWFFVINKDSVLIVYHLAAWALLDTGIVVGLISVPNSIIHDEIKTPRLVTVPSTDMGVYKHRETLTDAEMDAMYDIVRF